MTRAHREQGELPALLALSEYKEMLGKSVFRVQEAPQAEYRAQGVLKVR